MEEATIELREAVKAALEPPASGGHPDRGDELLNDVVQAHGSSEGTYISSLSGSLPSERNPSRRRNCRAANDGAADRGGDGRRAWQRRLRAASRVENAVSSFELAAIDFHDDAAPSDDDGGACELGGDVVDLLVAVLTSVPRNLFHQADLGEREVPNPRQEEEYLASMEQICLNAGYIASDVVRKFFRNGNSLNVENRHVYDLIEEVVHICNTDPSDRAWSNIEPVVSILNSILEGRHIEPDTERCANEREQAPPPNEHQSLFSCLSSKDTLRLVRTLMYRYICEQEEEGVGASSPVGYFIGYLLEHFAHVVASDMGYPSSEGEGLFDAWADGVDEQMARRLNDEEAREVHDLVVRYHIGSIQVALQLIENAESVISTVMAESEKNDGIDNNILESVVIAVQDTIRHTTMAVTTTEAMEKLGLEYDPEIRVIFHPLIVSHTRFTTSCLHEAILLLRRICESAPDGEEMRVLADDLLFRLCRVTLGQEFLKGGSTDTREEEEEVIALSLLRAMNSQCIAGKARFLLDLAADRVRGNNGSTIADNEPAPKRQRFCSTFGRGQLPRQKDTYKADRSLPAGESRGEMMDSLLACLALSRSNHDGEHPGGASLKTSCITSALMFSRDEQSGDGKKQTVMDPLNPWHTFQAKAMRRLAEDTEGTPHDSILSYSHSTPHLLDTKY